MKWDVFIILEQLIILVTISSQLFIAFKVITSAEGAEQYVRIMAFLAGLLIFLIMRPLGMTFADLMLSAHAQNNLFWTILIGGLLPFSVGVFVSEATILAIRLGSPIWIRFMLIIGAFTICQATYTNYVALTTKVTTLDKAFIPNLCYAVAIGIWLTFRYKDTKVVQSTKK